MSPETHSQLANFIWSICNLLRGPYKRNEYRKVILPLTVLRRFDCLLAETKSAVLEQHKLHRGKADTVVRSLLEKAAGHRFYNLSRFDFAKLLDDTTQIAQHLDKYIKSFSPNVREIFDRFAFDQQIAKMAEKDLLYEVVKAFARVDLSPTRVDNVQMGYVFEELIRIGAEQSNEEAGEHFTPREVIKLMVNLLLSPEKDLRRSHVVKTIFDPACGTGGMLSVAEDYIRNLNADAKPMLYGQDLNDEAWAVCRADMLIKGENAENIRRGDSFTEDQFDYDEGGRKVTFDYMLANPPFGVEWKQQQKKIEAERDTRGFEGRFGAGTPRINDGSFLFLQHMLSKMATGPNGSRIAIVFNGSPLFTGDAGSGESEIRRWIIENDWLEAIVALPDQLFYNTGIATYIWILTNRKERRRKGKIQLIDARNSYVKMRKSLGNKRNKIGDKTDGEPDQIGEITRIYGGFTHGETRAFQIDGKTKELVVSKIFANEEFGYQKITVERPLRLNFAATRSRIALLDEQAAFQKLASSSKKAERARLDEIEEGKARQEEIRKLLTAFAEWDGGRFYKDRARFLDALHEAEAREVIRLSAPELKAVLAALGERDETAEICRDRSGNPEPDPELRDTETMPLLESIDVFMAREVLPHVSDAWVDERKTKIGYEISLNRYFYVYEPTGPLDEIQAELKELEAVAARLASRRNAATAMQAQKGLVASSINPMSPEKQLEFKSSNIEWLGDVPAHWRVANIRRFAQMRTGHTPSRQQPEYWENPTIPWFTLADVWQLRTGEQSTSAILKRRSAKKACRIQRLSSFPQARWCSPERRPWASPESCPYRWPHLRTSGTGFVDPSSCQSTCCISFGRCGHGSWD